MKGAGGSAEESDRTRRFGWGRAFLLLISLVALYGAGAVLAPYVPAGRFEEPLKQELERALGRGVELSDVRFSLYPSPGLSAKNLVIHDAPEFGLEPLAYVSEIQVGLRWTGLLRGRIECGSIGLVEASVNVARNEAGEWNFVSFLEQMTRHLQHNARAPKLQARDSRINFRDGLRKSPFFLNSVDVDLSTPSSPNGDFTWNYEASPARTDRSAQGFGQLTGSGQWRPAQGEHGTLDVDIELERSVIAEVAMLLTGRDPGVQGQVSSRVRLSGPPENIQVRGTLRLGDLKKPSLFGARGRGEWSIPYSGAVNLEQQTIDIATVTPKESGGLPVSIRLSAGALLTRAAWQAHLAFDGLPAATLLDIASRLGAEVPPGLKVEGTLTGPLEFDSAAPAKGVIELRDGSVRLGETSPYKLTETTLKVDGTRLLVQHATLAAAVAGTADVSADWDIATGSITAGATLKRTGWKELRAALAGLPGLPLPAGLTACDEGELDGDLRLERAAPPADQVLEGEAMPKGALPGTRWSGALRLAGMRCALDGTAEPARIEHGQLTIAGPDWNLRRASGRLGTVAWSGEASWQPPAGQAVKFNISVDEMPASELERVFRPALVREGNLLERTLAFRKAPLPEWLATRRWDGHLTVGTLPLGRLQFSKVAAHVIWNGASIDVADLDAREAGARIQGRGSIRLSGAEPAYELRGVANNLEWEEHGAADAELSLSASGVDAGLLKTLRCTGQVNARRLEVGTETLEQVAAEFDYSATRSAEPLRITGIEAVTEGTTWLGSGGSAGPGRWRAELASGLRTWRLAGTFLPLKLESEGGNEPHER